MKLLNLVLIALMSIGSASSLVLAQSPEGKAYQAIVEGMT